MAMWMPRCGYMAASGARPASCILFDVKYGLAKSLASPGLQDS